MKSGAFKGTKGGRELEARGVARASLLIGPITVITESFGAGCERDREGEREREKGSERDRGFRNMAPRRTHAARRRRRRRQRSLASLR